MVERILASRSQAPFIYNDFLILVPSVRMRRMYGRLFLDVLQQLYGATALVQPKIQTIHQLFEDLYKSLHGPPVMDENSRSILLEGLVKERLSEEGLFHQNPNLLAPSLSSALAKMIEQLAAAGVSPDDLFSKIKTADFLHKPQVELLIHVYTRYREVLQKKTVTDPAGMHAFLLKNIDPFWFAGYREIIIEGIHYTDKLEKNILWKIAALSNSTCIVEASSQKLLDRAKDYHPLAKTKDFIDGLGNIPVREEMTSNPDDLFLASALFSDKSFENIVKNSPAVSSFAKEINLLSAVNTREEISLIARRVKKSIRSGTPADTVLVAFPSLDEYGPLIEEIFTDYGIPYNRALGRQLSTSQVATSIMSLLNACVEDFSGPSLLRILSSPFLKYAEQPVLALSFDRFIRYHRIIGGKEKLLSALRFYTPDKQETDILTEPLSDLFSATEPFVGRESFPLGIWMDRLKILIDWSGIASRVEAVHGPLNINLQAYLKLNEAFTELTGAGRLFPEYNYTFYEWLFLLKKICMHTRFQVPPEDEDGVQILGMQESIGHPWKEIYLGGLTDGKFPQRQPQNIFLPDSLLNKLEICTPERERTDASRHFYRLLLSAEKVTLSHPENEGDRPVAPSPFLEELAPLLAAGLVNRRIDRTSGIQFSLKIEESNSLPELAKAIAIKYGEKGNSAVPFRTAWLTVLSDKMPGFASQLTAIRAAIQNMPIEPSTLNMFSKSSTTPLRKKKRQFSVTELDDYINCPYDYYIKHVLGIEILEEVTEDISPLDRGSKVHAILRNFYLSWNEPVVKKKRQEAANLLKTLADSAFDREADTIRNRREKELFLNVMIERFLNAEEEFWKQGMRPAYLEHKIEFFKLSLSDRNEVDLSAKIDRIDIDDDGNFIIVDYKTGKYPQPQMSVDQNIFQLPVYSILAISALSCKSPALKKSIGLAYYDLAGKIGAGARDVVLYNKDIVDDQPASKPNASRKSAEEFETILKLSLDKARKAVEGILSEDFKPKPHDDNKCRYCPNDLMCRKKEHDR